MNIKLEQKKLSIKKVTFLLIIISSISRVIYSQDQLLSLSYDSIAFDKLAEQIEKEANVNIYYMPEWLDSMKISIHVNNKSIHSILDKILEGTDISYLTNKNNIIFTKGYHIKSDYNIEYKNFVKQIDDIRDTVVYTVPKTENNGKNQIEDEYKVFRIGNPVYRYDEKDISLSGFITNKNTDESIIGCVVYANNLKKGTVSNGNGFYEIKLPAGQYQLEFRSMGMKTTRRNVILYSNGRLDVKLDKSLTTLEEVTIVANKMHNVQSLRMGIERINMRMIKQLPMGMGEADIIKTSMLLPGVQSVGEAASGFNIRGGSTDQNLVLLDQAPIINTSHFFGFFSAFNSEIIDDLTLYKSGIPAQYGGRVSSVMNIKVRQGNTERHKTSGGINPISARLLFEGPIIKKKCSFLLSMRTTYSDWILKMLKDKQLNQSTAGFYDIQGNIAYNIDKENKIYISGYYSKDDFDYYKRDAYQYNNFATTIEWDHTINKNLLSSVSFVTSNYKYNIDQKQEAFAMNSMKYNLNQFIINSNFNYHAIDKHTINFGLNSTYYYLSPGKLTPLNDSSIIIPKTMEVENALETALFINDEYEFSPLFSISGGIRLPIYIRFGPKTERQYNDNLQRTLNNVTEVIYHDKGKPYYSKVIPEYRISSRIKLNANSSIKLGITRTNQFIHMISNTATMSPTDIWKLSDKYIQPTTGNQFSIGYYINSNSDIIQTSVETYIKNLNNIIDYKGGDSLVMNDHLETVILNGHGKAYGIELMVKKPTGKLSGWISYTYSRILHKIDDQISDYQINKGLYYPANYDKPHDFKFVFNYKLSRRLNITTNYVYNTGRPITYPVAFYEFMDVSRTYYSERNGTRMPDYARLDFAATYNGNLRAKKLNHSSFTLSIYNVFGRQNPYTIFFKTENGVAQGYQLSIFGKPIVTLTYNFKIRGNASDDF